MNQAPLKLTLPDRELAYQQCKPSENKKDRPSVLFLGGFVSDMSGTKALFLDDMCSKAGYGFLRFDYRGHGLSSGTFEEGCIGDWFADALQMVDKVAQGPQIVVGSSMGGWIGLLLARARPDRIKGFIGVAAAPDFTEDLIRPTMTPAQYAALEREGFFYEDLPPQMPDDQRVPITKRLMDDGINQLVLRSALTVDGPVRLLQGQDDVEVPWKTALRVAEHIEQSDVRVTLVKDAGHRFSRESDLALIWQAVCEVVEGAAR